MSCEPLHEHIVGVINLVSSLKRDNIRLTQLAQDYEEVSQKKDEELTQLRKEQARVLELEKELVHKRQCIEELSLDRDNLKNDLEVTINVFVQTKEDLANVKKEYANVKYENVKMRERLNDIEMLATA